jgi:hypothetical protein
MQGLTNQFATTPATVSGFQYNDFYWSSTPDAGYSGYAWGAGDYYGYVGSGYGGEYYGGYQVRCVR